MVDFIVLFSAVLLILVLENHIHCIKKRAIAQGLKDKLKDIINKLKDKKGK